MRILFVISRVMLSSKERLVHPASPTRPQAVNIEQRTNARNCFQMHSFACAYDVTRGTRGIERGKYDIEL